VTELVSYRLADGVAIIAMDDGKVNALALELIAAVHAALEGAATDGAVVVLTGRPGIFSGGFDLKTLQAGGPSATAMLEGGFTLALRLLEFPAPVTIACNGHAVAMGLFLLLCGDHTLGVDGPFRLVANEVAIGLTMPWTAVEICRQRLTPAGFIRIVSWPRRSLPGRRSRSGPWTRWSTPRRWTRVWRPRRRCWPGSTAGPRPRRSRAFDEPPSRPSGTGWRPMRPRSGVSSLPKGITRSMQVIILGSGGPLPDPQRAGPSTLVRTSAGDFLFDCGRGVLMRAAAAGSAAGAFRAVLLTHLHSDHVTDLNDVFTSRWITSFAPNPLPVYGPPGTDALLGAIGAMLAADIGYRLAHHDDLTWPPTAAVGEVDEGVILEDGAVRITAAPTEHAPVRPTVGYRVDDGEQSVVIAGDTVPCAGLDELSRGAGVLVHTVVRRDLIEQFGLPRLTDVLDYHSSVADAADTAARNGVGTLLLTHLVPAPAPGSESEWLDQARAHFGGQVIVGTDLLTVEAAP
jgi:ribonuclease Z